MKPCAASGFAIRSSIMPSTMSSETRSPASITAFALRPSGVLSATARRKRSPVDTCGRPKSFWSRCACVPFPEPGAPSITILMFLFSEHVREGRYASVAAWGASNALEPRAHDREDLAVSAAAARGLPGPGFARVLPGLANQRAQSLRVGVSIVREPALEGRVALEQRIPFALGPMQEC